MTDTVRIGNDTALRQRLMAESAMSHPAKAPLPLIQLIADRYGLEGHVLDIMAGSGSTMILALRGIDVTLVELEHHFLWAQHQSWAKMRQNPMLGYELGTVTMLWGDAKDARTWYLWPYRELAERYRRDSWDVIRARRRKYRLRLAEATPWLGEGVDSVLVSPPYQMPETQGGLNTRPPRPGQDDQAGRSPQSPSQTMRGYTRPRAIVTSPPFEQAIHPTSISEEHWTDPQRVGQSQASQARLTSGYTRPNAVVVSPPYEGSVTGEPGIDWSKAHKANGTQRDRTQEPSYGQRMASHSGYTRQPVDSVLFSPPYEGINDESRPYGGLKDPTANVSKAARFSPASMAHRYTRPKGEVSCILTSPPFGETQASQGTGLQPLKTESGTRRGRGFSSDGKSTGSLGGSPENIGNLRGPKYFASMSSCYAQCHALLQPGSLLILILKGFTRDGVYQDLPQQTINLLEAQGWKLHDRWRRELASLSFWRVLQGTDAVTTKLGDQMGLDGEIKELLRVKRENNGKLDPRLRFEHIVSFERLA